MIQREKNTVYIATISGGKDSVTMCDLLLKNGYPVDYVVFTDTLQEFKEMYDYINKVNKYFKERYRKEITILKPESTFEDWCFGTIQKGERQGLIRGLPSATNSFCYWRREAKVKPMENFIKSLKSKVVLYIGFTRDEKRSVENTEIITHKYPLKNDFKMTEDDCKAYLIKQEMENPLYRDFSRTGCRMCPFQSDNAWNSVYKNYRYVWDYMKDIESKLNGSVNDYWFANFRTCKDMEKTFNQGSLFDFSDEPLKDCFCKI